MAECGEPEGRSDGRSAGSASHRAAVLAGTIDDRTLGRGEAGAVVGASESRGLS